ncbi:hypothetical protein [Luteibacter aegosomatissinici]|uniref:hypothetical protein n=1 Tax=Luteibacter aegosomatissinici TaxID=2911539 RepID=UPI001FF825CC|nr:hypothetical protein [Luteibacter aegosomatissinici]UPG96094.1 hypothetical protein L2Y97_08300 [Luteibacter aegosomatissinici]
MALAITSLASACSAVIRTEAQATDTYDHWNGQMDHIPFLVHYPDGRLVETDRSGHPLAGPSATTAPDRVEVYVGTFPGPNATLCEEPPTAEQRALHPKAPDVVAALCDHTRTVVYFSDKAGSGSLADTGSYVVRVDKLVRKALGGGDPGAPDPDME